MLVSGITGGGMITLVAQRQDDVLAEPEGVETDLIGGDR
jgi:hypothetical protein